MCHIRKEGKNGCYAKKKTFSGAVTCVNSLLSKKKCFKKVCGLDPRVGDFFEEEKMSFFCITMYAEKTIRFLCLTGTMWRESSSK